MAYDPSKTYRLKRGGEVLSLHQGEGSHAVHGVIKLEDGSLRCCVWNAEHLHPISYVNAVAEPEFWTNLQLIEVKPRIKRTVYATHYGKADSYTGCFGTLWGTEKEARSQAERYASQLGPNAVERIEIDCEEGEGL